ncbi:MAG: DsbA family protein [Acholeplasmataceae bacterium]|nr:DsbA family protein [Acholeplasmataceae bacterium]
MKIEVWFDFNHEQSYQQIKEIDQLIHDYIIDDLELLYRSYPIDKDLTIDAHRLSHLAKKYHAQHEFNLSLIEETIHHPSDLINQEILKKVAIKNYLDEETVEEILASNAYLNHVESNLENALFKKIMHIPHIRIEGKIKLDGMQTKDDMIRALNMAKATLKTNEHCVGEHCGRKKAQ